MFSNLAVCRTRVKRPDAFFQDDNQDLILIGKVDIPQKTPFSTDVKKSVWSEVPHLGTKGVMRYWREYGKEGEQKGKFLGNRFTGEEHHILVPEKAGSDIYNQYILHASSEEVRLGHIRLGLVGSGSGEISGLHEARRLLLDSAQHYAAPRVYQLFMVGKIMDSPYGPIEIRLARDASQTHFRNISIEIRSLRDSSVIYKDQHVTAVTSVGGGTWANYNLSDGFGVLETEKKFDSTLGRPAHGRMAFVGGKLDGRIVNSEDVKPPQVSPAEDAGHDKNPETAKAGKVISLMYK